MTPRIGVVLADAPAGGWAGLGRAAAEAEAGGASSVWLTDHLFWRGPTFDVIGGLHAVAAATRRCTVGPCVLQLPLRHIASTAKSLSFLDEVSGGRVVVGVGVGEHEAEYRAAGAADRFRRRGALLDAGIGQLRACWSGTGTTLDPSSDDPSMDRRDATAAAWTMAPARPLPIWVGGRSDAALRRAAQLGDGWTPHLVRAPWLAERVGRLDDALGAAGRTRGSFALTPVLGASIPGLDSGGDGRAWFAELYGLPLDAFRHAVVTGPPAAVADEVVALGELGAEEVTLFVPTRTAADHVAAVVDALA